MRLTIAARFQGLEGRGQGGYSAGLLSSAIGERFAVSFRSPIPLDEPMDVVTDGCGHRLVHGGTVVMESYPPATTREPVPPVTPEEAQAGRAWAESRNLDEAILTCFSCGWRGHSLRVHAGAVPGRPVYATPVAFPQWAASGTTVDGAFLWASLDCAAGYRVAFDRHRRMAFTGRLDVDLRRSVHPGEPLVVVADADPEWTGRKREARSAMYTAEGELVAVSESLWISAE